MSQVHDSVINNDIDFAAQNCVVPFLVGEAAGLEEAHNFLTESV